MHGCIVFADTMFCVKWLAKLSTFIILVLVSEFVVVAILSECDHCGHIPGIIIDLWVA